MKIYQQKVQSIDAQSKEFNLTLYTRFFLRVGRLSFYHFLFWTISKGNTDQQRLLSSNRYFDLTALSFLASDAISMY